MPPVLLGLAGVASGSVPVRLPELQAGGLASAQRGAQGEALVARTGGGLMGACVVLREVVEWFMVGLLAGVGCMLLFAVVIFRPALWYFCTRWWRGKGREHASRD